MKIRFRTTLGLGICLISASPLSADWKDETGYTRLVLIAGAELPSAPSQGFTQVEAPVGGNFEPDTANALFTGKSFSHLSGASGISGHANSVATNFYGNPTSLVTGDCQIGLYNANGWLAAGFLNRGTTTEPLTESHAVQNHSWTGSITETVDIEVNQRLDFAIDRDGFVSVVGVNNGNSTTLPALLGQSYHTISVGLVNGNHSAGFTTLDGTGRIKPDIVAPDSLTSFATPMVASGASLLYSKLAAAPYSLSGADKPRVIKALLLATATKDTVASWSNTATRPLDLRYGAGELNINHAYNALRAGRATASNSTQLQSRGWAAESVAASSSNTYFFSIAAGAPSTPFSAALTWHRVITDNRNGSPWGDLTSSLADLNLRLYQANGFTLGSEITTSLSTVDNVELVYQSALQPGDYVLVVENASATSTPHALAWHSLPAVTIAATVATAREIDLQAGVVTITRTGDTTLPLFVLLTVGGSAISGTHFQALATSVTIAAGQSSTTLNVTPIADTIAQGDRSVSVAVASDFALVRDAAQSAVITIQDKPADAWRFAQFNETELGNPAISSDNADSDHDGLVNLLEYALALNPHLSSPSPAVASTSGGYLTLSTSKNSAATELVWAAEVADDLTTWTPAVVVTNTSGNFEARDTVLSSSASKRFIRLKITRP